MNFTSARGFSRVTVTIYRDVQITLATVLLALPPQSLRRPLVGGGGEGEGGGGDGDGSNDGAQITNPSLLFDPSLFHTIVSPAAIATPSGPER